MHRFITLAFASLLLIAPAAQPVAAGSPREKAPADRDKIVCKRFPKTGSLAETYRTCKPESEWQRERENVRQVNWSSPCKSAESGSCEG